MENIEKGNDEESREELPNWWSEFVNDSPSVEDLLWVADTPKQSLQKAALTLLEEHEVPNEHLIDIMSKYSNNVSYKEWAFEKGVSQGFTEDQLFEIVDRCPDFLDRAKTMLAKRDS